MTILPTVKIFKSEPKQSSDRDDAKTKLNVSQSKVNFLPFNFSFNLAFIYHLKTAL